MAEVWTLSEESIRKLAKLVSAQERELSNLRRHLAHYSTRRHEAVYLPGKKNPIFAYFKPHVSPDTPVSYPAKTSQCRKFPAYLYRELEYNDDPSSGGYSCIESLTVPASSEPVIVYNVRNWWVPENFLYPVWEYNGQWYTDYVKPAGPLSYSGDISSMSASSSNDIDGGTVDLGFDGHALTCDASTGVFTAHRSIDAIFHVNVLLELDTGPTVGNQNIFINYSSTGTVLNYVPATATFVDASPSGTRQSIGTTVHVRMTATDTIKFIIVVGSGQTINCIAYGITADTQCSQ